MLRSMIVYYILYMNNAGNNVVYAGVSKEQYRKNWILILQILIVYGFIELIKVANYNFKWNPI